MTSAQCEEGDRWAFQYFYCCEIDAHREELKMAQSHWIRGERAQKGLKLEHISTSRPTPPPLPPPCRLATFVHTKSQFPELSGGREVKGLPTTTTTKQK